MDPEGSPARLFVGAGSTKLAVQIWFDVTAIPAEAERVEDVRELTREAAGESALRHVAKVFLVDGEGRIRNVYGSGFLDASLLVRDLETLLGEHSPAS